MLLQIARFQYYTNESVLFLRARSDYEQSKIPVE